MRQVLDEEGESDSVEEDRGLGFGESVARFDEVFVHVG